MKKNYWLAYYAVTTLSFTAVVQNPILNASAQQIPKAECKSSSIGGLTACGSHSNNLQNTGLSLQSKFIVLNQYYW